ncbi:MAG: Clp protease ClpP [Lachnospiraceae bacterium]|nr:Clp protease ClpP [Lachnospiraceae bacterium]
MKTKKFWNWRKVKNQEPEVTERILELNGTIAEESWFDDDVTPQLFKDELNAGSGDITVWINSPGGDCVAAAQIYNMLSNYKGKVTVKIDGIAASAASVIAMAGDTVLVSPVSMLMIHNPATIAWGDHAEMQKAIDMLSEVKESIINAYVLKTGLSRPKLSHLMDAETWMDANKAVELGFADGIMARAKAEPEEGEGDTDGEEEDEKKLPPPASSMLYSRRAVTNALLNKMAAKYGGEKPKADIQAQAQIPAADTETGRSVDALMERLNLLKR